MARVELKDAWTVGGPASDVRRYVLNFLETNGMKVESAPSGEIHASQGSQLATRTLGGWFVPAKSIPKRALVRIREERGKVRVEASIGESLGFGYLDPKFKKKYLHYFESWMAGLKSVLMDSSWSSGPLGENRREPLRTTSIPPPPPAASDRQSAPRQVVYVQPVQPPTNGLAVAGLVLGILGVFVPLLGVLALIFGGIALSKASQGAPGKAWRLLVWCSGSSARL